MAIRQRIPVAEDVLDAFCKRWKISKLEEFDSAFGAFDADVYVLATVDSDANWSLFDHNQAELELGDLLGKKIELVTRGGVESNPLAPRGLIETARPFHGG